LGYIEGNIQTAFGNVTSQSFGGEAGANVGPDFQIFIEGGHIRDSASSDLGNSAQMIAGALAAANQGDVTYQARQPINFGLAGVRYLVMPTDTYAPYVLGGGGFAQVNKDVDFSIGGNEVTSSLSTYGVVLGSDLSGRETKGMISLGAGVVVPWRRMLFDFQYRFGRIFTDNAFNVHRAGLGIGVLF